MAANFNVGDLRAENQVASGKTKVIYSDPNNPGKCVVVSKDDITAGDGRKHDFMKDKAKLANETTCNVFRLLKACGIPVAFDEQNSPISFLASFCRMLPYEVVVRREGHGSCLKRNPGMPKGKLFPKLVVEFFLKTSGRKWGNHDLPCDDPLMLHLNWSHMIRLYEPSKPVVEDQPFLVLREDEVYANQESPALFEQMENIARRVFLIAEKAWQIEGRRIVDFKIEFGIDKLGRLLLADVIDNDSWRVLENGQYIDKQVYRDGGALDEVAEKYARVARITGNFRLPKQQILVWRGSKTDDFYPLKQSFEGMLAGVEQDSLVLAENTCSMHKTPIIGICELQKMVQAVPDTVVIAFVGRSNGAGPTLSAHTTVPVITVPVNYKDFPDDVWSSLRTPSDVPVVTVLEPSNAMLAAFEILSMRNPLIYMLLRSKLEERLVNVL